VKWLGRFRNPDYSALGLDENLPKWREAVSEPSFNIIEIPVITKEYFL
jgi:hypothetical protein